MRLQNFLLEDREGRSKALDEKTFNTLLNTKFTDSFKAYNSSMMIRYWRGTKTSAAPFMYTDPKKFIRSSISNQNYYTLIMSYDPSWSKFPPRDKCIVASTNKGTASNYGKAYVVLPENGAKIGIAPSHDIWSSWRGTQGGSYNLQPLLDMLENLFLEVSMADDANDNINGFKKACKLAEKKINSMSAEDKNTWHILTGWEKYDSKKGLYKWVTEMFSPTKNDFKVIKAGEPHRASADTEIWTDGECLLCDFVALQS